MELLTASKRHCRTIFHTFILFSAFLAVSSAQCAAQTLDDGKPAEVVPAAPASAEPESSKSYILPALEILGFQVGLNIIDRNFASDEEDYESDIHSIRDNLEGGWALDRDSFDINQVGHPYQGSVYFNLARSNGLNFWESLGYTAGGSVIWEIAGETTKPSVNDQVTTTFGGSFLGEALFRTAETFFASAERTNSTIPEVAGAIVSPSVGVNRQALETNVTPDLEHKRPALRREIQVGWVKNDHIFDPFAAADVDRDLGQLGFRVDYGLPGKSSYVYRHPFDYFQLDVGLSTSVSDALDHLIVNGLLVGKDYESGDSTRGVYGVFGSYTYIAPELFRVASSAVSVGGVGQTWLSKEVALQSSLLAGVGFGAGGTIHAGEDGRDYHYGAVPQGQASLRLIVCDRAALGLTGSDFFVTGEDSDDDGGSGDENVSDAQLALTLRVFGPHALSVTYEQAARSAKYSSSPDQHQRIESYGILYTYLFGDSLGAVDWNRNAR